MNQNNQIIFIVGPTAVGKTEVAIGVAQRLDAEIISCDAMQVYQEIEIASAKPSKADRAKVKHHCLDLVSVSEDFNVGTFREVALKAIEDIQSRGKKVIFCGGSGLYMTIMLDGIFEQASRNPVLREKLQKRAISEGIGALHRQLGELDPTVAAKIHRNDSKRVIRALEVCLTGGIPMSKMQQERKGLWGDVPIKIFALNRPREILYKRVEDRVDVMFAQGLVEEIQRVQEKPLSVTAATLIGIREVGRHLAGEYDLAQAVFQMKQNTRHFVKRQLTWFRKDQRIQWIEMTDSVDDTINQIIDKIG